MRRAIRHLAYLAFLVLAGALIAGAQYLPQVTPESKPQPKPQPKLSATLKVTTDLDCDWTLDGKPQGRLKAGDVKIVRVSPGKYMLRAASTDRQATWQTVVTIGQAGQELVQIPLSSAPRTKPSEGQNKPPTKREEEPRQTAIYPANLRFEFVRIGAGEFDMGCSSGDSECYGNEKPQHRVRISKGFEMGKYSVTQAMWESVMGSNPSNFKGADRPVEEVSWNDVQDFLQRMNAKNDGYRYRLPTEAEWEYAARAGSTSARYGELNAVAWYWDNSGKETHPVGQKQPNAWGLYDMLGNVWQWVQDWKDDNYYAQSPGTDPQGPSSGQYRVLRGGSWVNDARYVRASGRGLNVPTVRYGFFGFRCVREAK